MSDEREANVSRRFFSRTVLLGSLGLVILSCAVGFYLGRQTGFNHSSPRKSLSKLSHTNSHNYGQTDFASNEDGTWVVNGDPGPNVPPIGRSLFDYLTMVDDGLGAKKQVIPYPFQKLVASIQAQVRPESMTPGFGLKNVLIPLGRSLQRLASAPDFFRYPRVVVGVDGYPVQDGVGTGMFLRDRLFVGYNEKASVLEIVSYNEAAGRFEFQIAHDYKEGASAQAVYANRSVCLSCHQNATPIFSDRPWQETNFNQETAGHLQAAMVSASAKAFDGQRYMGIPLTVPEAQPQGLDNAKFRANLIPATHFLWQRLCEAVDGAVEGSASCRGKALSLALRMGLTNQLEETSPLFSMRNVGDYVKVLATAWKAQWPSGLFISNPRIPNRNPFEKPKSSGVFDVGTLKPEIAGAIGSLIKTSNIPAEFEPLNKRQAIDKWNVLATSQDGSPDMSGIVNWLRQMVEFFTDADWRQLDKWASTRASAAGARSQITGACKTNSATANKVSFVCEGTEALDPMRLAGFISWDTTGRASGGLENFAIRTGSGCDLNQETEQSACPEAINIVLRGQVTTTAEGIYQATLTATNRINGQRTRFSDGNLLESLNLRWKTDTQVAVVGNVLRDSLYIEQALSNAVQEVSADQASVLAKRPFRRTAVMTYLRRALTGVATDRADCCEADEGMPAAKSDESSKGAAEQNVLFNKIVGPAAVFIKECAVCHRNNSGFPPNYLSGSPAEVQKQMALCAERIWYRINMYDLSLKERGQSPMPPISQISALSLTEEQWRSGESLKNVRAAAASVLRSKGVEPPDPKKMNYESLPPCFGNSF